MEAREPAIQMDGEAFRKKRLVALAFLFGILALVGIGLLVMASILLASIRSNFLAVTVFISIIAALALPVLQIAFGYLRIARPSVSDEGLVPRRWTVLDVLRRRRIIPWSEIFDLRVELHPRGTWWITIGLQDSGWRYVRSGGGVPDQFLEACRSFAEVHGVPVLEESA